tara:strand:- start:20415 stop:20876 length:462 start_codon:yes stop_codon:yes gene_type:complete
MTTQFIAAAGSALAVSAALPATDDEAGYGALTYTAIELASDLGEFGPTDALVTFTPITDAVVQKAQGSRNYGSQEVQMAYSTEDDAGVAILDAAHAARASVSCKMTLPDGAVRFYKTKCMGVREIIGGADTVIGLATTLEITSALVKVAAPSG